MEDSFAEKDFLTSSESRQRKGANSTSKGFASNPLQMALLTKEKAEKRELHWNSL